MTELYRRFLLVRDDFYDDPAAVLAVARSWAFPPQTHLTGYRTTKVYHPRNIRRRLEQVLGLRITRWDEDPDDGNGVFFLAPARGAKREAPGVHFDRPETEITIVIYLTPGLPETCGTSFWRHRSTGLDGFPTLTDARRLGLNLGELRKRLESDTLRRRRWLETDRVGYRWNRLVAYPSGVFHSATRHYGSGADNGRIYQTFRIPVDWASSRIHC